jgi:hypothetical protein
MIPMTTSSSTSVNPTMRLSLGLDTIGLRRLLCFQADVDDGSIKQSRKEMSGRARATTPQYAARGVCQTESQSRKRAITSHHPSIPYNASKQKARPKSPRTKSVRAKNWSVTNSAISGTKSARDSALSSRDSAAAHYLPHNNNVVGGRKQITG